MRYPAVGLKFGITIGGLRQTVLELAPRVEALGYDSAWTGEHLVWRSPTHDGMLMMTAAAAVTKRIRIGTSILLLPLKHPVLVAKAVTTIDHISGGRFNLGIGVGGENPKEFEAAGVPVNERGPRANESLEVMKRLWTEDRVTFQGRFFRFTDIALEPKPVQKPHPPVLVAGRRKALDRVARYADGWMPYMYTPEMYREDWQKLQELAPKYGRDAARIERTLFMFIAVEKTYEAGLKAAAENLGQRYGQDFSEIAKRYAVFGTPQQCAERLLQYRQAGAEHFIFSPSARPERAADLAEMVMQDVVPLVRRGR